MADDMLSAKSLAKRWDCRLGYVYKQVRDGKLASVRFGSHMVRIPLEDIVRFERELWDRNQASFVGDLECTEESLPPSSEAELSAAASQSMRLTRALQKAS